MDNLLLKDVKGTKDGCCEENDSQDEVLGGAVLDMFLECMEQALVDRCDMESAPPLGRKDASFMPGSYTIFTKVYQFYKIGEWPNPSEA